MPHNIIEQFYQDYFHASENERLALASNYLNPDVRWSVAHPINDLRGPETAHNEFLSVLTHALPDVERLPQIIMNDKYEGRQWYNSTGYFVGVFEHDLFGIPATGKTLYLRYTEMVCVENQQITECYLIPDFIDAMNQAGVNPLRTSLGHDGLVPPPATNDGITDLSACTASGEKSAQLVNDMLTCLGRFDGQNLFSMDLENYWHSDFMWYGPAGIGTTRGVKGFRNQHQGPFVFAFPDRSVDIKVNMLANNNYVSTGGWPHMHGTHTGDSGWLGLAPTGKHIEMRVMDLWRREGELLKENWVAIDIVHILHQLGYDVFKQMKEQQQGPSYA
ncbi:ester cyclase [Vibrio profundum]|uniref:nuclear transport factor 2 family protein n=1 Tax=Vibrio profundum TaxID=2910247 RepID=UPI003D110CB9